MILLHPCCSALGASADAGVSVVHRRESAKYQLDTRSRLLLSHNIRSMMAGAYMRIWRVGPGVEMNERKKS